jgi:putative tryptophan/tyrosine transport system substrate-binding protein
MKRRKFIVGLGSVISAPLMARAQTLDRPRRVGVLSPFASTDSDTLGHLEVIRSELAKLGWKDGQDVQIDYRWGDGDPARIRSNAKELVELKPDVLLGRSTPVARALAGETQTIPIIFVVVSDPVGDKLVTSIARPGGNVTGFTNVEASLGGKWLGILRELAPPLTHVAILFNPKTSPGGGSYYMHLIEDAAKSTTMKVEAMPVNDAAALERSIEIVAQQHNSGIVVLPDVLTTGHRNLIIKAAERYKLPTIYAYRYIAAEGGLASYGVDVTDLYRRAAAYADRILRGDKAADLPVQAPIKFELAINLKAARALGLAVPSTLLAVADEVIE